MKETLLYSGIKKVPFVFEESQINAIFSQIIECEDYPKTIWGEWEKWRDVCLIASVYLLALRPKEACCLRFKDFNLRTMFVKIRASSNKVRKERIIPVPKIIMNFYRHYFAFSRHRFWRGSTYLFPSLENEHISPQRLKHIFREKVLKPLGFWEAPQESTKVPRVRLYSLRHSRATQILNKQIKEHGYPDIHAIANLLGHGDIRSTQVYLHADKNYMEYLRGEIEL